MNAEGLANQKCLVFPLIAFIAVVLAGYSFWLKLKREEKWLSEEFGESYQIYCQRVAALIPFVL